MITEPLITHFTQKILDAKESPQHILANFYCTTFDVAFTADVQKEVKRLVDMYGKLAVFNAIVAFYDSGVPINKFVFRNIASYARKFLAKRYEKAPLLTDYVNDIAIKKQNIQANMPVIPNPFIGEDSD